MLQWIADNWFNLVQTVGIVAGLLVTAYTIRQNTRAQRITNLFSVTQYHREIWTLAFERPELQRVLVKTADLVSKPIQPEERRFVAFLILHLNCTFEAIRADAIASIEGLDRDVGQLFSLPIPAAVWADLRPLQNARFTAFVDECRSRHLLSEAVDYPSGALSHADTARIPVRSERNAPRY